MCFCLVVERTRVLLFQGANPQLKHTPCLNTENVPPSGPRLFDLPPITNGQSKQNELLKFLSSGHKAKASSGCSSCRAEGVELAVRCEGCGRVVCGGADCLRACQACGHNACQYCTVLK